MFRHLYPPPRHETAAVRFGVAGDLICFDMIVCENGAVVAVSGRHVVVGHLPNQPFLQELRRRRIPLEVGESVVEADAQWAGPLPCKGGAGAGV